LPPVKQRDRKTDRKGKIPPPYLFNGM